MKPIYEPKGKAKEYGDLAINIYTGCPHRCYYCFAPSVLRRDRAAFHENVNPRPGIVQAVKDQIESEHITGKMIHLCFTCDPYPTGYDSSATREIIKIIKESGNHVQILTKGDGSRDFDLLDGGDVYGISCAGYEFEDADRPPKSEPGAVSPKDRIVTLYKAHKAGIKTWISFEPVLNEKDVLNYISVYPDYIDKFSVGKLNYHPSNIVWSDFGRRAEATLIDCCKMTGAKYQIKDSLRKEMER